MMTQDNTGGDAAAPGDDDPGVGRDLARDQTAKAPTDRRCDDEEGALPVQRRGILRHETRSPEIFSAA